MQLTEIGDFHIYTYKFRWRVNNANIYQSWKKKPVILFQILVGFVYRELLKRNGLASNTLLVGWQASNNEKTENYWQRSTCKLDFVLAF